MVFLNYNCIAEYFSETENRIYLLNKKTIVAWCGELAAASFEMRLRVNNGHSY